MIRCLLHRITTYVIYVVINLTDIRNWFGVLLTFTSVFSLCVLQLFVRDFSLASAAYFYLI